MSRYRTAVAVVEAMQWTGDNIDRIWDWAGADKVYGPTENNPDWLRLIGGQPDNGRVNLGDWIVRSSAGVFFALSPEAFGVVFVDYDHFIDLLGGDGEDDE